MIPFKWHGIGGSALTQAHTTAPQGYVFGATEGEHLIHFRDGGKICIKVGPAIGSDNLTLGSQQVPVGGGIPIHRHLRMDEPSMFWKAAEFSRRTMLDTLLGRAERYSFRRMLGTSRSLPLR
jgi:hypothetical protein